MKRSFSFVKTSKQVAKDIESKNAQLLIRAGFIKQEIAGVYTYLNLGLKVLTKIENIVRKEMDKIGTEILMPGLSSQNNWKQTNRLETIDVLLKAMGANKLSQTKNSTEYVLNPTHEDVVTPLVQSFVKSYKDLPVYVYQIQNKYRNEPRAKSGLLRGREFRMKDLYSFSRDEKEFEKFYESIKQNYLNVFRELGLGADTFITVASGGDFTKRYSHEFQTICETGEDTIYLDRKNSIAYNKEIVTPEDAKKLGVSFDGLEVVKSCEVGNIFPLETKFTDAFDFQYVDEKNQLQKIIMGSYGIGISRLMGVIAEKMGDEKGLVWPENIAPFKYQLISLQGEGIVEASSQIYQKLGSDNCLWDDREVGAGEKFADADLIGCPVQIVVSSKTLEKHEVEVRSRNNQFEIYFLPISELDKLNQ